MTSIAISTKIFLLLFVPFLFSPTTEAQVTYPHHNWSSSKTFSPNSAFKSDLSTLLCSLLASAANIEFYNTTLVGGGDTVHDHFKCRGEVINYLSMLQQLSSEYRDSKEAIIWYDECMLRYSNNSFFSTVNTSPRLDLSNTENNVSNQENFMRKLYDAMNKTADEAAKSATGKQKFAIGAANVLKQCIVGFSNSSEAASAPLANPNASEGKDLTYLPKLFQTIFTFLLRLMI